MDYVGLPTSPEMLGQILLRHCSGYIEKARWFQHKLGRVVAVEIEDVAVLEEADAYMVVAGIATVTSVDSRGQTYRAIYNLPLVIAREKGDRAEDKLMGRISGQVLLFDAGGTVEFVRALYRLWDRGADVMGSRGKLSFVSLRSRRSFLPVKDLSAHTTNTVVLAGGKDVVKVYRRLEKGGNPELEVLLALEGQGRISCLPALSGYANYVSSGGRLYTLYLRQEFIPSGGSAWEFTLTFLKGFYQQVLTGHRGGEKIEELAFRLTYEYLICARRLGEVVGELHSSLARISREQVRAEDVDCWYKEFLERLNAAARTVDTVIGRLGPEEAALARQFLQRTGLIRRIFSAFRKVGNKVGLKLRCHNDLHLDQVLMTGDRCVVIDFEGQPAESLEKRRARHLPFKDLAGMMRSFGYAAEVALSLLASSGHMSEEEYLALQQAGRWWRDRAGWEFLRAYRKAFPLWGELTGRNEELARFMLAVFQLDKALYEVVYEMNNRPSWVRIPLAGMAELVEKGVQLGGISGGHGGGNFAD